MAGVWTFIVTSVTRIWKIQPRSERDGRCLETDGEAFIVNSVTRILLLKNKDWYMYTWKVYWKL